MRRRKNTAGRSGTRSPEVSRRLGFACRPHTANAEARRYRWFVLGFAAVMLVLAGTMTAMQNSAAVIQEQQVEASNIYSFTFISQEAVRQNGADDESSDSDQNTDSDEVYYSDSLFDSENGEYDHVLARASLALSMTSFRQEDVTAFLGELGYKKVVSYRYDQNGDEDKSAMTMASKNVNDDTIVAVVMRSGKYGDEWGSNGRVGYDGEAFGYHYGFREAAEDALVQLREYAAENSIDLGDVTVWVTGFSRGAAVANVLGMLLQEEGVVDSGKLFDYTFATPSTVSESSLNGEYSGIYNVVNPLDIVTRLPMNASGISQTSSGKTVRYNWDYTKYGTILELPTESKSAQLQVVQLLEDALAFATRSEQRYVESTQDQVMVPALKKAMGKGADVSKRNVGFVLVEALPGVATFLKNELDQLDFTARVYVASILSGKKTVRLEKEHWPETYWGWMVKVDGL